LRQALCFTGGNPPDFGDQSPLGWGIPDATKAALILGLTNPPGIGPFAVVNRGGVWTVYCTVFSSFPDEVYLNAYTSKGTIRIDAQQVDTFWYAFPLDDSLFTTSTIGIQILARSRRDTSYMPVSPATISRSTHIPCGMRLPASVVGVRETQAPYPSASVVIHPNPAEQGSVISVQVAFLPHTMRIVETSTGAVVHEQSALPSAQGWRVMLPSLAGGHYLLVVQGAHGTVASPLIIR
jgi:hypothetical protein